MLLSRKEKKTSLNEYLHKGPVMLQDLTGILLRFRLNRIALVSDIEKAFLQISLTEESRDETRFLWLKNRQTLNLENNIQQYRFCRVLFGIILNPFLLTATPGHRLKIFDSLTAEPIRENIYVDNVITGSESVNDALAFHTEAKHVFQKAGMNMRDGASKSEQVLDKIDSKKSLNTFVKEIKEQKDISFHYIPTKENPADIASRGVSIIEIQRNKLVEWTRLANQANYRMARLELQQRE